MLKKILLILSILIGFLITISLIIGYPMLYVATGYSAKKMCSCYFIGDQSPERIQKDDLANPPLNLTKSKIDESTQTVTSSLFGMASVKAVYRENLGCVLLQGEDDYNITLDLPPAEVNQDSLWPVGERVEKVQVSGVDYEALKKAIDNTFDASMEMETLRTQAVVVVYKDTLIAEKYANGISENTELLGWSMTKSITSALVGILAKEGKMSLEDNQLFEHWTDGRKDITLKNMLQMQSGLAFEEEYSSLSDATEMLYKTEDIVERASRNKLETTIGSKWYYSSGTTNMIMGLVRKEFNSHEEYLQFPYTRLFRKIGMNSAVLEIDESGNYIGSSYCYATPRDWAKFGLLYLNNGNWYGEQIIDTAWVDFTRQPAEHSGGIYGGQFWMNVDNVAYPDVPDDLFSCNGFEGQFVYIIPSRDLVVVRMGLGSRAYDANTLLKEVIAAVESTP